MEACLLSSGDLASLPCQPPRDTYRDLEIPSLDRSDPLSRLLLTPNDAASNLAGFMIFDLRWVGKTLFLPAYQLLENGRGSLQKSNYSWPPHPASEGQHDQPQLLGGNSCSRSLAECIARQHHDETLWCQNGFFGRRRSRAHFNIKLLVCVKSRSQPATNFQFIMIDWEFSSVLCLSSLCCQPWRCASSITPSVPKIRKVKSDLPFTSYKVHDRHA